MDDADNALNRGPRAPGGEVGEREGKLGNVLGSLPLVLLQAGVDGRFEARGSVGAKRAKGREGGRRHLDGNLGIRLAWEGSTARQKLVEDDPQRPNIGPRIDLFGRLHLLGGHVIRRAHDRCRVRDRSARIRRRKIGDLGNSEVEHFDDELPVVAPEAEEIGGFQVPVNNPDAVGAGHAHASLKDEVDGLLGGQRAVPLNPRREVFALQELHDHVRGTAVEGPHVQNARDVLALDLDRRPGLAGEALDDLLIADHPRQQKLDGHLFVELQMLRGDDHAHATDAEHPFHAVLAGEDFS